MLHGSMSLHTTGHPMPGNSAACMHTAYAALPCMDTTPSTHAALACIVSMHHTTHTWMMGSGDILDMYMRMGNQEGRCAQHCSARMASSRSSYQAVASCNRVQQKENKANSQRSISLHPQSCQIVHIHLQLD